MGLISEKLDDHHGFPNTNGWNHIISLFGRLQSPLSFESISSKCCNGYAKVLAAKTTSLSRIQLCNFCNNILSFRPTLKMY